MPAAVTAGSAATAGLAPAAALATAAAQETDSCCQASVSVLNQGHPEHNLHWKNVSKIRIKPPPLTSLILGDDRKQFSQDYGFNPFMFQKPK